MAKKDREKGEQRRTAREQRREAQRREEAQRRRQRTLTWTGAAVVVVVALFALLARGGVLGPQAAALLGRQPLPPPPGERVPELPGNMHIEVGAKGKGYTTNPPTSGEHYGSEAPWGVHATPVPDELVVHNLEHGGIWISYKDPKDSDLAAKLAQIAQRYKTKVIVTPREANDDPIAVAAWGHLLKLEALDEAKIVAFIDAYRGKVGPEPNAP